MYTIKIYTYHETNKIIKVTHAEELDELFLNALIIKKLNKAYDSEDICRNSAMLYIDEIAIIRFGECINNDIMGDDSYVNVITNISNYIKRDKAWCDWFHKRLDDYVKNVEEFKEDDPC